MNPNEYQAAKARSCITVADIWFAVTKMTKDQDKAYSAGRTVIPDKIAKIVLALVDHLSTVGKTLADTIRLALGDGYTVDFNDNTGVIMLTFPSMESAKIVCAGVDTLNLAPVYVAAKSTKNEAIFIYIGDKSPWMPGCIEGDNWFLWRGNFLENRNMARFQNYFNKIDGAILGLAFNSYA